MPAAEFGAPDKKCTRNENSLEILKFYVGIHTALYVPRN